MLQKSLISALIGLAAVSAAAQTPATSSPAKKDYAARIVKMQQAGVENLARNLAEQPASELMGSAASALPARVAKDKQEAVAKEIQADVKKYLDEAVPLVQARAIKLAPATVGALLEEKFTEDELKQLVAMLEAPVYGKFQKMGDEMQKALADKVIADTRSIIEPKVRALEQSVGKRLGVAPATGAAPPAGAGPRAPARPASR